MTAILENITDLGQSDPEKVTHPKPDMWIDPTWSQPLCACVAIGTFYGLKVNNKLCF